MLSLILSRLHNSQLIHFSGPDFYAQLPVLVSALQKILVVNNFWTGLQILQLKAKQAVLPRIDAYYKVHSFLQIIHVPCRRIYLSKAVFISASHGSVSMPTSFDGRRWYVPGNGRRGCSFDVNYDFWCVRDCVYMSIGWLWFRV